MRFIDLIANLLSLSLCSFAEGKAVFAHFMVENAASWSTAQWQADIRLAQEAHIDAFAMNIRLGDPTLSTSLQRAFEVSEASSFKLLFSFDYAGGGAWSKAQVISLINQYSGSSAYFRYNGKPFVSTFEGPAQATDWHDIRSSTNCYFVPDWSSAGAKKALELAAGAVDGLFSWAAWPWGNTDMDTFVDASYLQFLNDSNPDLTYMMPVSPWFFTNLPGYSKNWLWRGDDLWYERWQEVLFVQPEFVEILTWNDFGESHYIGPLHDDGMEAFTVGRAPFNYVNDMPHDGWRKVLPYFIDQYKQGVATIKQEELVAWYRLTPKNSGSCSDGETTGNTVSQLQLEFHPADIVQDKIFYSAVLSREQAVRVTIGGFDLGATWMNKPQGGIGVYHGSVDFGSRTGPVVISVGSMVVNGKEVTSGCSSALGQNGVMNWNAWVGSSSGGAVSATPALNITEQVCIRGTGPGAYSGLCSFACGLGYCPLGACNCLEMGAQPKLPGKDTPGYGTVGYPAAGKDATFSGLCGFSCPYGYCPPDACDSSPHPLTVLTVSPFTPNACIAGTGEGNLGGLCGFSCNFGYCPIHVCTCTGTGPLVEPPALTGDGGTSAPGLSSKLYDGLCSFACSRGYCPKSACLLVSASGGSEGSSGSGEPGSFLVYLDPSIWTEPKPLAACYPPCTLVFPPFELPQPTTITFKPITTGLAIVSAAGSKVTSYTNTLVNTVYVTTITLYNTKISTTTIVVPPVTTKTINFWNAIINPDSPSQVLLTQSILPPVMTIAGGSAPRTFHPPPWPTETPATTATTSNNGVVPIMVPWTSSKPKDQCTTDCGTRCVGLFCIKPCSGCAVPDPDWWDPQDPVNPWPPSDPYKPEPERCTTTSADRCTSVCSVVGTSRECSSSCSLTYGCSVSATTKDIEKTYTPAPFGTMYQEGWPGTLGTAYTSSIFSEVRDNLMAEFPTVPPSPRPTGGTKCSSDADCLGGACDSGFDMVCMPILPPNAQCICMK